ncbi:MAG: VapC toxin family PIN domain ribonuclease [Deltaproteobacteria bacterium]|nr:VapC toxin family PIN domain ribonuclease [Deltaproteobacteria bacterium]
MIIADTGFWLALANRKDKYHLQAVSTLRQINEDLITTWPVFTECCHLLLTRLSSDAQIKFIRSIMAGAANIFAIKNEHMPRIAMLMEEYHDLPMDLADASLVILAECLGSGRILSTDQRDFHTYRWKSHKPFKNLLL